jgi:bifunctional non-homologous end joining protein LigD
VLTSGNNENIYFYVFDLLHLDGEDLQDLPLLERKKILKTLLKKTKSKRIIYSEHWETRGSEIFAASCKMDLEGIISKDSAKGYSPGRGKGWLKSKCKHVQEFVVGGYTPQKNGTGLGSLMMGAYDEKHKFRFIGKIGTGYGMKESTMLLKRLKKLHTKTTPFEINTPKERAAIYVKPELVANVEFAEWTDEKVLRHAAYKGLREDKSAKDVYLHEPTAATVDESPAAVELSHPDKVLFPKTKNTKQDLADYYTEIQKWILPHIIQRPLSLLRCPSGAGKQCFFQKHLEAAIPGIFSDDIGSKTKGEMQEIIYARGLQGLLGLVQMNTLELHTWGCHTDNIDNPDLIVFDLDPDSAVAWTDVKKAALTLKKMLEKLGLKSFLKVTGGKGLHLHVPVEPIYSWDQIKSFAKSVCDKMALDEPSMFLTTATKSKRKGKIFLDYLRNGYGATAIVPYSARANPNATVAYPLSWTELAKLKAPDSFNITNVPKLLKKRKDPWTGYHKLRQRIKLLDKL